MMTLCLTAFASGCVTSSCDWAEPIRPSSQDVLTTGTERQILTHNETGAELCRNWGAGQ